MCVRPQVLCSLRAMLSFKLLLLLLFGVRLSSRRVLPPTRNETRRRPVGTRAGGVVFVRLPLLECFCFESCQVHENPKEVLSDSVVVSLGLDREKAAIPNKRCEMWSVKRCATEKTHTYREDNDLPIVTSALGFYPRHATNIQSPEARLGFLNIHL